MKYYVTLITLVLFISCNKNQAMKNELKKLDSHLKEEESIPIIAEKEVADKANLDYSYIASWITLTVHSLLEAVGLTAAFSNVLSENGISCNVVAAYYHNHIFVDKKNTEKAIEILNTFSK